MSHLISHTQHLIIDIQHLSCHISNISCLTFDAFRKCGGSIVGHRGWRESKGKPGIRSRHPPTVGIRYGRTCVFVCVYVRMDGWMRVYVCSRIFIFAYLYLHIYICIFIFAYLYLHIYICIFECLCKCLKVRICICACTYVCMCVCIYVCVCTYGCVYVRACVPITLFTLSVYFLCHVPLLLSVSDLLLVKLTLSGSLTPIPLIFSSSAFLF